MMTKSLLLLAIFCIVGINTMSQVPGSQVATGKTIATTPGATKISMPASALLKTGNVQQTLQPGQQILPVNSPNIKNGNIPSGKTADWCVADKVTGTYVQMQMANDPNYAGNMNKMYQQIQQWIADNPNYLAQKAVKTIPVVVHVIYNTPDENVSNALIYDMMNTLNEDFRRLNADTTQTRGIFLPVAADAQIEFCLAQRDPSNNATTGIVRKSTTKTWWDPDNETNDMKANATGGDDPWNPYNYLNIWICDIDNGAGYGTAGYAYLPTPGMHGSSIDGLVIDNSIGICFGCRTATHEIGHYLGLKHTWGNNPPSCNNDDGFTDTPTSSDENFGCNYSQNTCSNDVPNMLDQIENYMSYADCQNMYTTMQANYMNGVLNGTRSSLLSSQACQPTAPPVTDFSADRTTVTEGQYIQFTDLTIGGPTSWSWDFGGGGTPSTSFFQNPFIQFSIIGTYTVTLTATNSLGSDAEIKNTYINVIADTSSCDMIHWSYLSVEDSLTLYYADDGSAPNPPPEVDGWLSGANVFDDKSKAQLFAAPEYAPNTHITGGLFWMYYAYKSGTSNGRVVYTVWDDNGAGGSPGTVLGTDTVDLADVVAEVNGGYYAQSLFMPPLAVSGNFYYGFQMVGFDLWAGGTKDTLVIVQTQNGAGASGNLPWEQWSDNSWNDYGSVYGFTRTTLFIIPFMTDMPTSVDFTADLTSGCAPLVVNFDASASQNFDSLYWDVDGDDTADYVTYDSSISIQYNAPGTYSITAWSFGPCGGIDKMKKTSYITINPVPTATTSSTTTACVGCNGTASVTATGGTTPYNYVWNDPAPQQTTTTATGLCAGSYQVLVTDAKGCTANGGVSVNTTAGMALSVDAVDATCGLNNGTATANISGGTPNYTYLWTGGGTASSITGLAAGTYNVTVTDLNGCTVATDFFSAGVISSIPYITDATASGTDLTCFGVSTGTVSAIATTGTTPYIYSWTGGCTNSSCTGLAAGSYTVTMTDNYGCTSADTVTITQPNQLFANASTVNNVSCNGGNNGSVTSAPAGGTGAYTYSWAGGQTTATATGFSIGTFSVTVTDGNGCTATGSATVTQPAVLNVTANSTNVSCAGGSNGTVSANGSGGESPYNYVWSSGATSGLPQGTYTVTVTDSKSCTAVTSTTITQPALLTLNISKTDVACNNGTTGTATANPGGGAGSYSYSWSNAQTTQTATGLNAATFTVTVTDGNGCTILLSTTINEPALLTASITSSTNVSCFSGNNGTATVTAAGGTSPYSYSWASGQTTSSLTGLSAGTYTVTVSDNNGCSGSTSIDNVTITEPAELIASIGTSADPLCYNGNDGSATASAIGGTGSFTYNWSNGQTNATATGLSALSYYVVIRDANACPDSAFVTLGQPIQLTVTANVTDANCGQPDGDATANPSGGTGSYTYNWSFGGQTTQTATGLAAGVYTVTVSDANNCSATQNASVSNAGAPILSIATTGSLCYGSSDGTSTVTATGGAGGYTYLWDVTAGSQTTSTATGLSAGTYSISVTDAVNCISTSTATVGQPALLIATAVATGVSCNGLSDGSINLTVTGGNGGYTYIWIRFSDTTLVGFTEDLTGLPLNGYGVQVTDSKGCQDTSYAYINEPSLLTVTLSKTNVSCYGGSDGTATATAGGGTSSYSYLWSDGQTNSVAIGLINDAYDVTVTDGKGCTATSSISVTEPALLTAAATSTGVSCNGGSDGTVSATGSGGTIPYSYAWSSGTSGLTAGTYTVTVTDNNGCSATSITTLTEPNLLTVTVTSNDVSCYGGNDGTVSATASGGVVTYTYNWSSGTSGLTAGTYTVTVTDNNGCTVTAVAMVSEPAQLTATATATDVTCNGGNDGTVSATASGGVGPYTYSWSSGTSGLSAGTYTVSVTDSIGCFVLTSSTVTEPSALSLVLDTMWASCGSCNDGSASVTPSGGTGSYTYLWSDGQTDSLATGLLFGTYTVTVTDANGCTATDSVYVDFNTSLGKFPDVDGINVFPNPTNGRLYVSLTVPFIKLRITNIIGETIFEDEYFFGSRKNFSIDLSREPGGIYFMRVDTDDGMVVMKVTLVR
ncbi:MAG: PKD domain-containing protein [Bacteroidetes bacterium]|nr:PKD domain-containing protein [Bacteroidota bacterium]